MSTDAAFATLGVAVGSPTFEIKRAFRALTRKAHPDHGGDAAHFAAIVSAYRELQNAGFVHSETEKRVWATAAVESAPGTESARGAESARSQRTNSQRPPKTKPTYGPGKSRPEKPESPKFERVVRVERYYQQVVQDLNLTESDWFDTATRESSIPISRIDETSRSIHLSFAEILARELQKAD
jgi:hypothetical protein